MKKIFTLLLSCIAFASFAQTSTLRGLIKDEITQQPLSNAVVILAGTDFKAKTAADGVFSISGIPYGSYTLEVKENGHRAYKGTVNVNGAETILGSVGIENSSSLIADSSNVNNISAPKGPFSDGVDSTKVQTEEKSAVESIPVVSISETDITDATQENVSSALGSSRDIFLSTSSFIFSEARFRIRGYPSDNFFTYMNGVPVNDVETGRTNWGSWGGLNVVLHNYDASIGLKNSDYSFGGVGGTASFDSRAGMQRKQLEISYANTDRNFNHRLEAVYSTGVIKGGWAFSAAFAKKWAKEGYIQGTFYDGYSYFFSAQKFFGQSNSLALTIVGSPTKSGGSSPTTQEMYDLAGSHYYNPDWGYQNGQKRNAAISRTHQPVFLLTHEWKIDNKSSLITAAGFSFGKREKTGIDWNNAPNPKPDYYANLPSYLEDSTLKYATQTAFKNNQSLRQIDWDGFYDANRTSIETIDSVDGVPGRKVTGKRARYIVEDAVQDTKKFNFNTVYNNAITSHISVTAGLTYQFSHTENYKKVEDLLGADFFVDVNQFAARDFPGNFLAAQDDIRDPNRILHVGDKYGYDYFETVHKGLAWLQAVFKYKKFDFFASGQFSGTSFWRNGLMQNGLFPQDSYGKSDIKTYFNYAFKGGITYKIDGHNYLYLNGLYETRAPLFQNAFISSRTRNDLAVGLGNEQVGSTEIGYELKMSRIKIKADMYFTQINNQTKTTSFYDDDLRTLVNYTLSGINTRSWGGELGAEAKIYKGFGASAVLSIGKETYTNRPSATVTQDNNNVPLIQNQTVYIKNFRVTGTPQLASSFGLNYHAKQNWFVSVNFNYYDWMYLEFNPARRTIEGVDLVAPNSPAYYAITDEYKLKGQFTMDLYAGYTWQMNNQFKKLKKKLALVINVSATNVTNNRNFVVAGYEQTRFDFAHKNLNTYPPKITYGYGVTYFLNVAFRMN